MGEEKIGQGKENAVNFIETNPKVSAEVEAKVRALVFPDQVIESKDQKKKAKTAAEENGAQPKLDM